MSERTTEAALAAEIGQLEEELDAMTLRLIETQDQLLALYDLTHTARNHASIQDTLDFLAREASRLVRADGALAILAGLNGVPVVAQWPQAYLSNAQALALFQRVRADHQELVANIALPSPEQMVILDSMGELAEAVPRNIDASGGLAPQNNAPRVRTAGALPSYSVFMMPIRIRGQVSAALGLLNGSGEAFESPAMKLARTIAEQGGAQLENALLLQEIVAQARVQTEMELAKRVQLRLLPQALPRVPGLDIAAYAQPALQVGGDFYDVLVRRVSGLLPTQRASSLSSSRGFTFAVGDVSGKGMAAALLMSMMHTALRTIAWLAPQPTPANITAQANVHLYDDLTEVGAFITLFVGHYDHTTRRLTYANAGHTPVIYRPVDGPARLLEADGPGIGVLPLSLCQDFVLRLGPGDLLIAATDGFSEAHNDAGEMFGHERLLQLAEMYSAPFHARERSGLDREAHAFAEGRPLLPSRNAGGPGVPRSTFAQLALLGGPAAHSSAQDILNALLAAIKDFTGGHAQDDDQTVIVLRGVPA